MQKPGATPSGLPGTSVTLTQKCGISDVDEIRLAYAPLLSVVDNNLPSPTADYIEPGGAKQINKSCELYCWLWQDGAVGKCVGCWYCSNKVTLH